MKLTTLHLDNFSVVRHATFGFSPGINVFVGRNGAGKSHVMKLLYSMLRSGWQAGPKASPAAFGTALKEKLAGVYRPDERAIGRLVNRGVGRKKATIELQSSENGTGQQQSSARFTLSTLGSLSVTSYNLPETSSSVYLPTHEVLAMYEGFLNAYEQRELSFDETYRDLCLQLSGTQLRGPRLTRVAALVKPLETIFGGSIRLEGNRFYRVGPGGSLEAPLLSEGLRKIGALIHLLLNGSLMKNGFLFWDEPETNLNPKLVTAVAHMLKTLSGYGVQVFVATHDFLLLNQLALDDQFSGAGTGQGESLGVKFFGMNLSHDQTHVTVQSADRLAELEPNDILDEFAAFYDRRNGLMLGA